MRDPCAVRSGGATRVVQGFLSSFNADSSFALFDTSPPLAGCLDMLLRRLSSPSYTCANTLRRSRRPLILVFSRSLATMADPAAILPASSASPAPPVAERPGPVPHTHPGYVGRCVLAPMVRTGELPTRLLALRYGADAVWGTVCPPSVRFLAGAY